MKQLLHTYGALSRSLLKHFPKHQSIDSVDEAVEYRTLIATAILEDPAIANTLGDVIRFADLQGGRRIREMYFICTPGYLREPPS